MIAPQATINIVREYEIAGKSKVNLLDEISSILECSNPNCITNTDEPVTTHFTVLQKEPLILRCHYCERILDQTDVETQFKVY